MGMLTHGWRRLRITEKNKIQSKAPTEKRAQTTRAPFARSGQDGGRYDGNSKGNSNNKCSGKKRQQGQNKTGVPERDAR